MGLLAGLGFVVIVVVIAVFLLRGDRSPRDDGPTEILPPRAWAGQPKVQRARVQRASAPVLGRGLILSAEATSRAMRMQGQGYEVRRAVLDVEIPGCEPYVVEVMLRYPRGLVRAVPGDTLDVRVDSNDPRNVVVLGPGGFTGPWLRAAQSFAQRPQRWS
jgi:hypothetical protein